MDVDAFRHMSSIFHVDSVNPRHNCYQDPKNKLKIYLENLFGQVERYFSYELLLDKGVYLFITYEMSNFGIIHGSDPKVHFEVAGFDGSAAQNETEAIEFLIGKIMEEIIENGHENYDLLAIEKSLRRALSSQAVNAI